MGYYGTLPVCISKYLLLTLLFLQGGSLRPNTLLQCSRRRSRWAGMERMCLTTETKSSAVVGTLICAGLSPGQLMKQVFMEKLPRIRQKSTILCPTPWGPCCQRRSLYPLWNTWTRSWGQLLFWMPNISLSLILLSLLHYTVNLIH